MAPVELVLVHVRHKLRVASLYRHDCGVGECSWSGGALGDVGWAGGSTGSFEEAEAGGGDGQERGETRQLHRGGGVGAGDDDSWAKIRDCVCGVKLASWVLTVYIYTQLTT